GGLALVRGGTAAAPARARWRHAGDAAAGSGSRGRRGTSARGAPSPLAERGSAGRLDARGVHGGAGLRVRGLRAGAAGLGAGLEETSDGGSGANGDGAERAAGWEPSSACAPRAS